MPCSRFSLGQITFLKILILSQIYFLILQKEHTPLQLKTLFVSFRRFIWSQSSFFFFTFYFVFEIT